MWLIRISLCLFLIIHVVIFTYLRVRNPNKDGGYCDNKIITRQVFNVIVYNLLCYAMVLLPPARTQLLPYHLFQNLTTLVGFVVLGILLITGGIGLSIMGVIKRKAIGGQYAPEGLVTSGVYGYFRHPIYSGIVWMCLGLALVTRNLDGLLMCPAVVGVNISVALMEERFEVGVRFRDQYHEYKHTVPMFGPKWLWYAIVLVLLTLVVNGYIMQLDVGNAMRQDSTTPDTRLSDDPMRFSPATVATLRRLMLAGLDPGRSGGLLHCRLRYFDPINRRAGIPQDVAALIDQMTADYVAVTPVNVSQTQSRQLVVQTGAYAEHECTSVVLGDCQIPVNESCFTVRLAPGAGARMVVPARRYSNTPTFTFPWDRAN